MAKGKERIFLSWAGIRGRKLADHFTVFLRNALELDTFYSPKMDKGEYWFSELQKGLAGCAAGIVFVTPESITSQWQSYEVGAMAIMPVLRRGAANPYDDKHTVCPILIGIDPDEVPEPLHAFHHTIFTKSADAVDDEQEASLASEEILQLALSLNKVKKEPIPEQDVKRRVNEHQARLWEAIKIAMQFVPPVNPPDPHPLYHDPLPPQFPNVDGASHSECLENLLSAIDAPAYFLDKGHLIKSANLSSNLLFGLTVHDRAKPLLQTIMENKKRLPEYEKVMDRLNRVTPPGCHEEWDFEPIKFMHEDYGKIDLQKIAISLRDENGKHAGWVVVFNIASIENAEAYYRDLRQCVLSRIAVLIRGRQEAARDINKLTYAGYSLRVCMDEKEKEDCRDFSYKQMLKAEHGLTSLKYVNSVFDNVTSFVYIRVSREGAAPILGVARLQTPFDLSSFKGIDPEITKRFPGGQGIADAGAYIALPPPWRFLVFEGLLAHSLRYLLASKVRAIYVQVPEKQRDLYSRLGFAPIGPSFTADGWAHRWVPMLLDIELITNGARDPIFQGEWSERTKQSLSLMFWNRILPYLDDFLIKQEGEAGQEGNGTRKDSRPDKGEGDGGAAVVRQSPNQPSGNNGNRESECPPAIIEEKKMPIAVPKEVVPARV